MKKVANIFIIVLCSFGGICQISISDSIQLSQDKTLKSICKEIDEVGQEISKIDSTRFSSLNRIFSDSNSINVKLENDISANINEKKSLLDMLYRSFGNLISALAAVGVALFVFYRRWKKEMKKEEEEKNRRIIEKNDYMNSILKKVIGLSEKYQKSIAKFIKEIENDPYKIPKIDLYPLQEFARLQKIVDNEEYFHAFLNKYGHSTKYVDNFRNIASLSDYLESQTKEFLKSEYRVRDFELKMKYTNLQVETQEDLVELGMSNLFTLPTLNNEIQQLLLNLPDIRLNSNQHDLGIIQTDYVIPLTGILLNPQYFLIPESRSLLNKLRRMKDIYEEIPMQNLNTSVRFKEFRDIMGKAILKLKEETDSIVNRSSD